MSAVVESTVVGAQPLGYLSDDHLISRLRAHDDDYAFAELVGRYERQLLAFCRRMLGSREDAEDVLQDTFASAYRAIRADERVIDARPWLFQIARNRCLNAIRGRRETQPLGIDGLEREAPLGTADEVVRRVELNLLVNDILALPDQQRQALVLHELEGCSYDQISRHLGASVASVRSLLLRARKTLVALNEARALPCAEVRARLEGSTCTTAALRRHLDACSDCARYRRRLKRQPARVLRAISPFGALLAFKDFVTTRILNRAASQATASGAGAAGAGTAATAGAGGAATTGAGLTGAAAKALAGLAALAAAGTGTVVVQRAVTSGPVRSRPQAVGSAPSAPASQSVSPVIPLSHSPAQPPERHRAASKPAPAHVSTTPSPATGTTPSQPAGTGGRGSQGTQSGQSSQSSSGVPTSSAPGTAGRGRPLPGSGIAPERTRPLPVNATNSQGSSGDGSSTGQNSSTGQSSSSSSQTGSSAGRHQRQRADQSHRHANG